MTKIYSLGRNRYVSAKKQDGDLHVSIAEEGSDVKTVTFPSIRWARFVAVLGQVDEAVNQVTDGRLDSAKKKQGSNDRSTPHAASTTSQWYVGLLTKVQWRVMRCEHFTEGVSCTILLSSESIRTSPAVYNGPRKYGGSRWNLVAILLFPC